MDSDTATDILTKIIKRRPVDIQFSNLSYSTGKKQILNSISGKFCSANFVGILGSSGAGKTTLLNVLAGYVQKGVTGNIFINGKPRNMKDFHKLSTYVMQEDVVQPYLTVGESIRVAINLKVGRGFTNEEKQARIAEVLSVMGLTSCINTRVEDLSGGQRKRFIIALELVHNPPVVFLDEPTTGLDDVSMKNCLGVLKSCTNQGRTIICTIHQPSASLIKLFDMIYFLSDGYCIYNGAVSELVPFLSKCGFCCPTNYNPADYIIEIVNFNGTNTTILKEGMNNGEKIYLENDKRNEIMNYDKGHVYNSDGKENMNDFSTSFWEQFWILLGRVALQTRRKKLAIAIKFIVYIIIGLLLGLLFYRVGTDGVQMQANVKYFYCVTLIIIFNDFMPTTLLYPFEIKILEREYFNRWYGLNAYYAASIISPLPLLLAPLIVFLVLVYFITQQPLELDRFLWFSFVCILTSIISERYGQTIGTIFSPTRGAIFGPIILAALVLISIYGFGFGEAIESHMKSIMQLSFPYHTFVGIGLSVLGNRSVFDCDDLCYFGDPDFMIYKLGWTGKTIYDEVLYLIGFACLHTVISYVVLNLRIASEFTEIRNSLTFINCFTVFLE